MRLLAVPLLLGPGVLACFSGGYFDVPRLVAGILAWLGLATVALASRRPLPRAGWPALAGLAGLTAWTAASLAWAPDRGATGADLQRLLLYLPYLAVAIAVLRDPGAARLAEPLLLLAVTGACAYGLAERMGLFALEPIVSAGDRLAYPLTYWNGTGAFAAIGLVLAAALAGAPDRPAVLRAAAAASGPVLALTLVLTFSRGALAALAAGLLLLVALAPSRGRLAAAAIAAGGGLAAAGLLTVAIPALTTAGGSGPAALLALAAACAGCALANRPLPDRPVRRGVAVAGAAAAIGAGAVAIAAAASDDAAGAGRLGSVQSNRYAYWEVAAGAFAGAPLHGEGSGAFRTVWLRERPFAESVRDAHSLYLETAAELGIVGLACLALLIGAVAVRAGPPAATAALGAFALHAGLDWDWELPAFTLVALALAALLIATPSRAPAAAPGVRGP